MEQDTLVVLEIVLPVGFDTENCASEILSRHANFQDQLGTMTEKACQYIGPTLTYPV
jgi:hypothetical protein